MRRLKDHLPSIAIISAALYGFFFCKISGKKKLKYNDLVESPLSATIDRGIAASAYGLSGRVLVSLVPEISPLVPGLVGISGGYYIYNTFISDKRS